MHFNVDAIKTLRQAHGLSLREFAARVGVFHQTVWAWEQGIAAPSAKSQEKIMGAFGVGPDFFWQEANMHASKEAINH